MNKRQRIHSVLALMAFLCISFCQKVSAQVQTLRYNTSMIANSKGYIEYLPQGYSASGTATYPLLIFIHGIGELGDGSTLNLPKVMRNGPPLLINKGTFPVSFTVNNQTFKFIVLSPQFVKWPTGADINGVISYALSHYKVDASRIYLTGFSMGGGAVWATASDVALYNKRIAAIVPMAGAYSATTARANVIADANVPVWAVHNDQDPTVPVAYTNNFVAYIKARNPSLPVKKTIYSSTSHNCWSRTYVPTYREDGLNIYEWMLQFKKGTIPSSAPATNQPPVANAGADKTITLPTSSVTLSGSGSDADGSISKYSWTK
ncbi:MAG: PKD domain-containing protein, partial [Flavisolibacter sp.]